MRPFVHADPDVEPHALRVGGRQHGAELGTGSRPIAAEQLVPAKDHPASAAAPTARAAARSKSCRAASLQGRR
jgi:hypothetical protein